MLKVTLKEATQIMEKGGYTFIKKERCDLLCSMIYFFEKDGKTYDWDLASLRRKANQVCWLQRAR